MRKIKKLTALMLAIVMVLAMSITAFASEVTEDGEQTPDSGSQGYTITLNGKNEGHTYGAYQVFKGTLFVNEKGEKVLSDIEWGSGVANTEGLIEELRKIPAFGRIPTPATAKDVADVLNDKGNDSEFAQNFADLVGKYTTSVTKTSQPSENDPKVYKITGLEAGYYLIKDENEAANDDAWTRYMMQVVGDVDATVKTDVPDIDKKIVEADSDNDEVADNNGKGTAQDVGSDVKFQLTSKVPDMTSYKTYTYTVHDTMSSGLTFKKDSVKVTIDGQECTVNVDYEVKVQSGDDGKTNITIDFIDFLKHKDNKEKAIVIEYEATINEGALVSNEEKNTVYLEYSNNPYGDGKGETPEKEVYVYDFDIVIDKYAKDDKNHKLAGAEFVLMKGNKYYFWNEGTKKVEWVDNIGDATKVITEEDGVASFKGLDSGDYSLLETKAPDGYNKLEGPVSVKIKAVYDENGKIKPTESKVELADNGQYSVTSSIENSSGSLLPSTGGIGTTIFYIIGAILVIGAGIILVVKKRMSNE